MLRLLALAALAGALPLATSTPASADVCPIGGEALTTSEAPSASPEASTPPEATTPPAPTPPLAPLAWCEAPDDPRCAPAEGPDPSVSLTDAPAARPAPDHRLSPPLGSALPAPPYEGNATEGVRRPLERPPR